MAIAASGRRAGVARRTITPPTGVYLIGYADRVRGNQGVHDELFATALVLDDGDDARPGPQVAIVALDLLTINEFVVDRIRAAVAPMEIVLCCSHTHSGPIAYADERSSRRNRAYIDALVDQVAEAIRAAAAQVVPVVIECSLGTCDVGINRREAQPDGTVEIGRHPDGPIDRSLPVVTVWRDGVERSERSGPMAVVVNYGCHGTVLGPTNQLVSADWIGAMRQRVESAVGGLTLFLQGASANVNPDLAWDRHRAFAQVDDEGDRVATAVIDAIERGGAGVAAGPLVIERVDAWLPTQASVDGDAPPRGYVEPLLALAGLPRMLAPLVGPLLRRRYPWKPRIEARDGRWSVPMRISVVRVGDLALVAFAAETFTEIGMAVKAMSPATHTLFASVTDGCVSYLATESAHTEGGYEVDVAPWAYRYPGKLDPCGEATALDATNRALASAWG